MHDYRLCSFFSLSVILVVLVKNIIYYSNVKPKNCEQKQSITLSVFIPLDCVETCCKIRYLCCISMY